MDNNKLLVIDLDQDQTTKIAQVISNKTARQILDRLADKDGTESELAKELSVPLSTVHYNLQLLVKSGLVVTEEYHYSKRGKEILHYKLANKYIIIAPKRAQLTGLKKRLGSLLPVGLITLVGAGVMHLAQIMQVDGDTAQVATQSMRIESAPDAAVMVAADAVEYTADPAIMIWYLAGAATVVVVYIIVELVRWWFERRRMNQRM